MPLNNQKAVRLPRGRTVIGFTPGSPQDYTGAWSAAKAGIETWWNTDGAPGHKIEVLGGNVGSNWSLNAYIAVRHLWQDIDVQPLITISSMFPQFRSDGVTRVTYDYVLAGNLDGQINALLQAIATDYPYSSVRIGIEVGGDWNWWGLGQSSANGATYIKVAQLHSKYSQILRGYGWRGTYEVNCEAYTSTSFGTADINQIVNKIDPALWDIAGVNQYGLALTGAGELPANHPTTWASVALPNIMPVIAAARTYNKRWALSDFGVVIRYLPGQFAMRDSPYYLQQVRAMALDTSLPDCAYLVYNNSNQYNGAALTWEGTLVNPANISSGPWFGDSSFSLSIAEIKSAGWTPAGMTRTGAVPMPTDPLSVDVMGRRRNRRRGSRQWGSWTDTPVPVGIGKITGNYGSGF